MVLEVDDSGTCVHVHHIIAWLVSMELAGNMRTHTVNNLS